MSFHAGASGGPDGLHPGHLCSLVTHVSVEAGSRLLSALTDLVNVMLRGEIPQFAVPIHYGANECAIRKKDGGIRPTAVGSTSNCLLLLEAQVTAYCCWKHKIVSKSWLKASRQGSQRTAEAGPVRGLNQWGMRGGNACGPTLCQGLSPQNGPSEDRHA